MVVMIKIIVLHVFNVLNFDIYVLLDRHKIFKTFLKLKLEFKTDRNDVCHEYLGMKILTISFLIVIIKQINPSDSLV
jgi:hypothetical protein